MAVTTPSVIHLMCSQELFAALRKVTPAVAAHIRDSAPAGTDTTWLSDDLFFTVTNNAWSNWWNILGQPYEELQQPHTGHWTTGAQ